MSSSYGGAWFEVLEDKEAYSEASEADQAEGLGRGGHWEERGTED